MERIAMFKDIIRKVILLLMCKKLRWTVKKILWIYHKDYFVQICQGNQYLGKINHIAACLKPSHLVK